ncbi:pyrroline-5-carboxylate reductase [Saccharobesus litoralis]|uniref:Pyrroline-5-carboxylate reductase n=1 Tax=Saccharobesus litoralis TaxID=2172099 RepID=A0A2S0VTE1_9ALTE|nr:pyrroline-5-carboxylate reductase [Saccharobesus litoralis]AWB67486.1 pyrroline-5-carboxylate reductase [Saccharobesus litoralis]
MNIKNIAFIGAGNMSKSIIGGLVEKGYPANNITAANPSQGKLDALQTAFNINITQDNLNAVTNADVVVLAVKPQLMNEMLQRLTQDANQAKLDLSKKLFISIAAGLPVARLNEMLGAEHQIIRTMPNTPSLLGLGMTGLYAPQNISVEDKTFANDLMAAVGQTAWVEDEAGIDKIIAVAGSAPAYFFLFMESLEQEAKALGFSDTDARNIVQQVALGSAQMVCHNQEVSLADLRAQVTSKGGTTAEAIKVFEDQGLRDISKQAMHAAIKRAEEMAKLF